MLKRDDAMNNTQETKPEKPLENGTKRERDEKTGRFVEGNSGGPGRPEGSISVVEALKRALAECPEGEKKTYLELLIKRILKKGIADGDVAMIKDIINRVDGMPKQSIDQNVNLINYDWGNFNKGDGNNISTEKVDGSITRGSAEMEGGSSSQKKR